VTGVQTCALPICWNQVNPAWPDAAIKLFGPGADSGTFDYFTEAVNGKAKASRGDFTASEDDNVLVQGVSSDVGALGYFGYAYYAENQGKMKAVAIDNGQGRAVPPSEQAVIDGTYNPLSRPIFIYVSRRAMERPEAGQFVEFYLANAAKLVKEVKYVPLPAEAYEKDLARFKAKATGTAYAGEARIGLPIADVFKLELKK
jgi:phosphate transport system substrate-binding protein